MKIEVGMAAAAAQLSIALRKLVIGEVNSRCQKLAANRGCGEARIMSSAAWRAEMPANGRHRMPSIVAALARVSLFLARANDFSLGRKYQSPLSHLRRGGWRAVLAVHFCNALIVK